MKNGERQEKGVQWKTKLQTALRYFLNMVLYGEAA